MIDICELRSVHGRLVTGGEKIYICWIGNTADTRFRTSGYIGTPCEPAKSGVRSVSLIAASLLLDFDVRVTVMVNQLLLGPSEFTRGKQAESQTK